MFSLRGQNNWDCPEQRTLQYSARCVPQMGPRRTHAKCLFGMSSEKEK